MIIYNNVEEFIALKPRYYKFLKAFKLTRNVSQDECSKYELEFVLSKISNDAIEDLQIRCINVFDINIKCIEGMFGLMVNIENISSRQLEGGTYRVSEEEEGAFSFYCEEFFAEIIK